MIVKGCEELDKTNKNIISAITVLDDITTAIADSLNTQEGIDYKLDYFLETSDYKETGNKKCLKNVKRMIEFFADLFNKAKEELNK